MLVAATGCGTTLPLSQFHGADTNQPSGVSGAGSGAGGDQAAGASNVTSSAGSLSTATAQGGSNSDSASAAGSGSSSPTLPEAVTGSNATASGVSTGSASNLPVKGQGWDAGHVYIGIITESDAGAALGALGVSINPGNQVADGQAITAELNKKGGLFGRQVIDIDKDDHSADVLANPTAAGQADCVYFTQDHPIIAVIDTDESLDTPAFQTCFQHAHTPLIALTTNPFDQQAISSLAPDYYSALTPSWTAILPVLMARLQAQNYFEGWNDLTGTAEPSAKPKVGVLFGNDPASSRIGADILADLHADGYAADSFQWSSDSDGQSAVLRFEQDAVTHVISTDSFQFFFMTAARSQHYLPRYEVTTGNGPQALLEADGNPAQLVGAVGIGWFPTLDTDQAHDPGQGPGGQDCLEALAADGQTFTAPFAEAYALAVCDGFHLAAYGAKAGGGLSPAAVRAGIVAMGASFPTGGSFASGLSTTNFAVPGEARDLEWHTSCSCFEYQGNPYRI